MGLQGPWAVMGLLGYGGVWRVFGGSWETSGILRSLGSLVRPWEIFVNLGKCQEF